MAGALLIQPDTAFIGQLMAAGGADLKKCYQCATCSAVCDLAGDQAPFPRRQMIEAQWGLKEKLAGDPALWLCHHCGTCTTRCPRGARPGDVMGALRRMAVQYFAFPRCMGRLAASPRLLPLLFLPPALIFAAIALAAWRGAGPRGFEFADMFPVAALEALFFTLSTLVALAFAVSLGRFARALKAGGGGDVLPGLVPVLKEIATHERFARCEIKASWRRGHFLTLWGFIVLAVVGTVLGFGTMFFGLETPLPTVGYGKLVANLGALAILIGVSLLLASRLREPASTYFDWFFLSTLAGVVLTGLLSQAFRLAHIAVLMYPVYFVHLVLIFVLFLCAPYSKFAHLVYRTVALASAGARADR